MKVIVVGAGFTGVQLARSLADSGAEVVLVENDPDKARVAREQVDCAVLEATAPPRSRRRGSPRPGRSSPSRRTTR